MRRGTFLKRGAGALVALKYGGKFIPPAEAAPVAEAVVAPVVRQVAPYGVTASGGLCAPLNPYYDLVHITAGTRPVRAALEPFAAKRGGITFKSAPS